jgi:NADH:ubiquinone oxidoreductase subunit
MSFLRNLVKKVKELRRAHEDARVGRTIVGNDRYNNIYYQYYDEEGNETRRVVEKARKFADDEIDLYWDAWLKFRRRDPPTPEQLKELYEEEEKFREAAYSFEKRDADMMAKYRKQEAERKKEENPQTGQAQGSGHEFEPGKWNPGSKKK